MTAEIAIANRSALALAADSVVTIPTNAGSSKKYDSAEKIFELCADQAVGMMIYNGSDFMNSPLDVIVRLFRSDAIKAKSRFKSMDEVWKAFEGFIMGLPRDPDDEIEYFRYHAYQVISAIEVEMRRNYFATRSSAQQQPDVRQLAIPIIDRVKADLAQSPITGFMDRVSLKDFAAQFRVAVQGIIELVFDATVAADDVIVDAFTELMYVAIKSTLKSDGYTGFVVAGFGDDDVYPSIISLECDGVYFGELRKVSPAKVRKIDRRANTAEIIPFAQSDMPERFIYGIDSDTEKGIVQIADGMLDQLANQQPATFQTPVGAALIQAMKNGFDRGIAELKDAAEAKVKSMVHFMSKHELAELAYHLVELVSRKRRFSDEEETVGGPIDVAIITKSEGFIWIRRKHYFDREYNPRFFERRYRDTGDAK